LKTATHFSWLRFFECRSAGLKTATHFSWLRFFEFRAAGRKTAAHFSWLRFAIHQMLTLFDHHAGS